MTSIIKFTIIVLGLFNLITLIIHIKYLYQVSNLLSIKNKYQNKTSSALLPIKYSNSFIGNKQIIKYHKEDDYPKKKTTRNIQAYEYQLYQSILCSISSHNNFKILLQLANDGNSIAQSFIARLYFYGSKHNTINKSLAIEYVMKCLPWLYHRYNRDNLQLIYNFGLFYEYGIGVLMNKTEAFIIYQKSYDIESIYALSKYYEHGTIGTVNRSKAIEHLKESAYLGLAEAQFKLGYYYDHGILVSQNQSLAVYYYQLATNQHHLESQYNLGLSYYLGTGIKQNYTLAMKYFKLAADQGDAIAQNMVGYGYNYNIGFDDSSMNEYLAFKYYNLSACQGNNKAQFNLALCYDEGYGIEVNKRKAFYFYKLSAYSGNANAQYNLAIYYEYGYTHRKNLKKAIKYYKLSAQNGLDRAQMKLGHFYKQGKYMHTMNETLALYHYQLAAEQDHLEAYYHIATLYLFTKQLYVNITQAILYYEIAALQNHIASIHNLGILQANQDNIASLHQIFYQAAAKNNPQAQYNLGRCYHYGLYGAQLNLDLAIKYYQLASKQGFHPATVILINSKYDYLFDSDNLLTE